MDKLQIINIKTNRYKGYLMVVNDPSRVKVGTDSNLAQNGLTLSRIVKKYNAAAGINAGGFTDIIHTGTQAQPEGMIIEDSKLLYADSSSSYNLIGFNQNNVLVVGNYSLAQIMKMNIRDAVSFGPSLIINGKAVINSGNGGHGIQPRSAIAQKKDGTILMLEIDGRQKDSVGATLKDVQDVLLKYGAYNAANLDGGSSTTMINGGQLVNSPCDILGERSIPSAFIVK
jgi:exopolysaccharide biosynthesis protein